MSHSSLHSDEIFIVDDDAALSELLSSRLRDAGYRTTNFTNGQAFVDIAHRRTPACVILDVFVPGKSGMELIKEVDGKRYPAPIIVMSARTTVPLAVEAVKAGAFDIIEKPFDADTFASRVRGTIERWRVQPRHDVEPMNMDFPGAQRLTARERDVLVEITSASSNKEAGRHLGLSPRTIEVHRAHIMMKLGTKNTADLVRFVLGRAPAT